MGGTMIKKIIPLTALLLLTLTSQALANQPPGPNILLSEILILPVMIIMTMLGGGYSVMKALKKKKGWLGSTGKIFGAVLAIIISGANEVLGLLVALIFALMALIRGAYMISWGILSWRRTRAEHLANAKPWRLIPAGGLLILTTLFLLGMAAAFVNYWPTTKLRGEETLKKFVTYQLAYAQMQKEKTGNTQFHKIGPANSKYIINSMRNFDKLKINYTADGKGFVAYLLPSRFPFFPYNYLTAQPTYRADESGQIRMIYVHKKEIFCPPDAPVVWKASESEIKEMIERINK